MNTRIRTLVNEKAKKEAKIWTTLLIGFVVGAGVILLISLALLAGQQIEHEIETIELKQQVKNLQSEVDRFDTLLTNRATAYEDQIDSLTTAVEADPAYTLEVVKKYGYVLKRVNPDDGFTLGMLIYGDMLAKEHNINPNLLWELCTCEGHFDVDARLTSSDARGLGGIMPKIGRWVYEDLMGNPKGSYNHDMAYDGYLNLEMMVYVIEELQKEHDCDLKAMINHYSGDGTGTYYNNLISIAKSDGINVTRSTYN